MFLLNACSYIPFLRPKAETEETKSKFILFNPFLKSNVLQDGYKNRWCFELKQGFKPSPAWHFCFMEKQLARSCFNKVNRLQKKIRGNLNRELYRPGEVVQIGYDRNPNNYKKRMIYPNYCHAYKIGSTHLIRSKEKNKNWRIEK